MPIPQITEAELELRFVTYAESVGCLALKLRIDGVNGFPDRTVIAPDGRIMFIEFKRKGGRLRPAQVKLLGDLWNRNCVAVVCDDLGQAENALDEFLSSPLPN